MDMKTAFFNGRLEESIYMIQPKGFTTKEQEQRVCKLQRSIYRLKQASMSWTIRFDQAVKSFGFKQSIDEPCVYSKLCSWNPDFLRKEEQDASIILSLVHR